jgi:hypothetical protein
MLQVHKNPWVRQDAASALDLATVLTRWFSAKGAGGERYLPDLELVPLEGPLGGDGKGPEGFLVCQVGPGAAAAGVQEWDVVTLVDQKRVVLTAAERAALIRAAGGEAEAGGELETAEILERAEGWGLQKDQARAIVAGLDPLETGLADVDASLAALGDQFAKALFGEYGSKAALTLWRRGGEGGGYELVEGAVELLRTRDACRRAEDSSPERCAPME